MQATIPAAAGNKPVTARPELTVREPPQTTDSLNTTSEHAGQRISMRARNVLLSADEHAQTSGSEHGDRHSPRPAGPICRQNPSPGARRGRSPPRCVELAFRTPPRHRAPGPGTWKDPDPRRRSSRRSEGPEQACLPGDGGYATTAGCPVLTTSRRHDLRRTCRLVTGRSHRPRSTWPNQAPLPLPAVRHRYKRHVVFGSNNFRSPCRLRAQEEQLAVAACTRIDRPVPGCRGLLHRVLRWAWIPVPLRLHRGLVCTTAIGCSARDIRKPGWIGRM